MSDIETTTTADASTAHMLSAAIELLRRQIVPNLADESTRIHADHLTHMLRWLEARLFKREDELRRLNAAFAANPPAPLPAGFQDLAMEEGRFEAEAAFEAALPDLLDRIASGDKSALSAVERMVEGEKQFFLALDPYISEGVAVAYRLGRITSEPPPPPPKYTVLDEDNLSVYLKHHFGRDDVSATGVKAIPGGFSKVTVFFTLQDPQQSAPRDLVIRMDMPFSYLDHTVRDEFPVLQRVFAAGLPVPEPLWLETDLTHFGAAFIVFERVRGTSNPVQWASNAAYGQAACEELAVNLGRLHAFKPSDLGFGPEADVLSAGVCIERSIAAATALFKKVRQETVPLLALPLAWMARNIPAELYRRPARVTHGDIGFHNVMVEDGKLTAMLDWEFCAMSDPTQDLQFLRQFVEPLFDWDKFMSIYLANGGSAPCPDTDFFFALWQHARDTVGCVEARALFDKGASDEVKFALPGHIFGQYLFIGECETLLTHLRTKVGSVSSAD